MINFADPKRARGVSSVGSERMLDRHEVTGSIPVHPTKTRLSQKGQPLPVFYGILIRNVLIYCVKDARLLPKYPIELNEKGFMWIHKVN